jgi:hypothetical protein
VPFVRWLFLFYSPLPIYKIKPSLGGSTTPLKIKYKIGCQIPAGLFSVENKKVLK